MTHLIGYVALQLSDKLLGDSVGIIRHLKKETKGGCLFFVVADSTYGDGDIDEVSVNHLNCNKLIFFGDYNIKTVTSIDCLCIRYMTHIMTHTV